MKKIILSILILLFTGIATAQPIPKAKPKSVGMDENRLKLVDKPINEAISNNEFPGAVLAVVRNGKLVYLQAYGDKQVEPTKEAMTTNAIFDLASLTKSTATAISTMLLLERGEIRLQDNVSFYLPDFQPWVDSTGATKRPIKIVNLLTHTSGLPAYASVKNLQEKYETPNPQGLMNHIEHVSRQSEPGSNFNYSCLNFITLQAIIEKVTGTDLNTFAKENIYEPLGMKHTSYLPPQSWYELIAPTEKQADGTILKGEVHDPLARIMNGGISGNAGLFSTAEDLAILATMLMNKGEYRGKRIMSPLTVRAMTSVPRGYELFGRSLGWDNYSPYASNNGDLFSTYSTFGHTGYTGTSMIIDPLNKTAVIFLTNRVHPKDKGSQVRLRSIIANIIAASIVNP